jgi:small subunit ribosomal protein S21
LGNPGPRKSAEPLTATTPKTPAPPNTPGNVHPRTAGLWAFLLSPKGKLVDGPVASRYSEGLGSHSRRRVSGRRCSRQTTFFFGARMVKLTVRERESIQEAVRRFRKLVERSGIKKEMRKREFFEKPSESRRRARLRAERRMKRNRLLGV